LNFDLDYVQIQWGKRLGHNCAVGANFNYASNKSGFSFGPLDVADSWSNSYDFRFGMLRQVSERLRFGIVFDYGFAPSKTTFYDFLKIGVGDVIVRDTTYQYLLRPGLAYEYNENSAVYLDYQFGSFMNDTGVLSNNRFYFGVDHQVVEPLFIRCGVACDKRSHPGWSAGVGVYPTQWCTIDIAYQYRIFPELEPEFGRSQTFAASLSLVL
jgi:hypothetical protein